MIVNCYCYSIELTLPTSLTHTNLPSQQSHKGSSMHVCGVCMYMYLYYIYIMYTSNWRRTACLMIRPSDSAIIPTRLATPLLPPPPSSVSEMAEAMAGFINLTCSSTPHLHDPHQPFHSIPSPNRCRRPADDSGTQ